MRRRLVVFVVSLMLVGCQGGGAPAPTAKVSVRPSASPSPTASPSPAVEFTGERLAAYESVRKYLDALYSWARKPKRDFNSVTNCLVDDAQIVAAEMMTNLIESKSRTTGSPVYRNWQIGYPRTAPDGVVELGVSFCMDLSDVKEIGPDGVEQSLDRTSREKYKLRKMDDASWRISKIENEESPC